MWFVVVFLSPKKQKSTVQRKCQYFKSSLGSFASSLPQGQIPLLPPLEKPEPEHFSHVLP